MILFNISVWCPCKHTQYTQTLLVLSRPGGRCGFKYMRLEKKKWPPKNSKCLSNLRSSSPLNPTRLPVTPDTACQKFSFTAHGQHGGSKEQVQWARASCVFFSHPSLLPACERQTLNSEMTGERVLK